MSQQTQKGQDLIFAIKQALVHEEINGAFELGALEMDFYSSARTKMKELDDKELSDATKALRKLMSKRVAKITRLASVSSLSQVVDIKLTEEEKALFNSIHRSCNLFKDVVTKGEI